MHMYNGTEMLRTTCGGQPNCALTLCLFNICLAPRCRCVRSVSISWRYFDTNRGERSRCLSHGRSVQFRVLDLDAMSALLFSFVFLSGDVWGDFKRLRGPCFISARDSSPVSRRDLTFILRRLSRFLREANKVNIEDLRRLFCCTWVRHGNLYIFVHLLLLLVHPQLTFVFHNHLEM